MRITVITVVLLDMCFWNLYAAGTPTERDLELFRSSKRLSKEDTATNSKDNAKLSDAKTATKVKKNGQREYRSNDKEVSNTLLALKAGNKENEKRRAVNRLSKLEKDLGELEKLKRFQNRKHYTKRLEWWWNECPTCDVNKVILPNCRCPVNSPEDLDSPIH